MLFTKQVDEKLQIMINELDLLWVPNFIALGIYFIFGTKFSWNEGIDTCFNIFGTKFSWNEGIDTCFNVKCVLLGRNFDFLGGYCSLPSDYCWLLLVTWWLLLVTARYWSFLLLVRTDLCIFCYIHIYFVLVFMSKPSRCPVNGNLAT